MEPIRNRVAESKIVVYDLAALWDGRPVDTFDLAPFLYKGLVLREKEFRAAVADHDWTEFQDRHVAVFCSTDAIIPTWAFMLVATRLDGIAASVARGSVEDLLRDWYTRALEREDWSRFQDGMVVIKGCGNKHVPESAYVQATARLQGVARKLMFGEPCSAVPLWRSPKPQRA